MNVETIISKWILIINNCLKSCESFLKVESKFFAANITQLIISYEWMCIIYKEKNVRCSLRDQTLSAGLFKPWETWTWRAENSFSLWNHPPHQHHVSKVQHTRSAFVGLGNVFIDLNNVTCRHVIVSMFDISPIVLCVCSLPTGATCSHYGMPYKYKTS